MKKSNILNEAAATGYTPINISEVVKLYERRAPLVMGYPPKPAFIQMDQSGKVTAVISDNDTEGTKDFIFNGLTMRWRIPETISGNDLHHFITRQRVLSLLERVHEGHIVEKSDTGTKAYLTKDAREANADLRKLFKQLSKVATCDEVKEINDWIQGFELAKFWPKNYTLKDAVEELNRAVKWSEYFVVGNTKEALLKRAMEYFNADSDQIGRVHVRALLKAGIIDQDRYDHWVSNHIEKKRKLSP